MKSTLWLPLASIALLTAPSSAVVVSYYPTDLADGVPGEDRWRYEYSLDEFPYDAGYGFTVYFEPELFADLDPLPPAPSPDWDPITIDPDVELGDPGLYDAESLVDAPDAGVVFQVSFRWLGAGAPGPQLYEVREPAPSYDVIEAGTTVLPEAAAPLLGTAALGVLAGLRRTRA